MVFAAASLRNALDEVAGAFPGPRVLTSYAGSSSLARQIERGAPASVFISADLAWMDYLEAHGLIEPGTRHDLLGNRLVLIAPAATGSSAVITSYSIHYTKLYDCPAASRSHAAHLPCIANSATARKPRCATR